MSLPTDIVTLELEECATDGVVMVGIGKRTYRLKLPRIVAELVLNHYFGGCWRLCTSSYSLSARRLSS